MRRIAFTAGAIVIAFVVFILARHQSYEPGEVIAAHANLRGQCASCHLSWHGPASDRCVACHGDIVDVNPHGGYDVTSDSGLIAGRELRFLTRNSEITCLSCHTEHLGRVVDQNTTATVVPQTSIHQRSGRAYRRDHEAGCNAADRLSEAV